MPKRPADAITDRLCRYWYKQALNYDKQVALFERGSFGYHRQAVMPDDAVLRASRPTVAQARRTAERVRPSLKPSDCRSPSLERSFVLNSWPCGGT